MTSTAKILLAAALLLSAGALTVSIMNMRNDKTIYFVNNGKLYDGFTLKIEYEKQIQTLRINRKNMLDSIELGIRQLDARKMQAESEYAQAYYIEKAKAFDEEESQLLSEYNQQIWKRLNSYAEAFSKEKHIDILFGASGNGTLLHADETIDLTSELIQYANTKYSGKTGIN